VQPVTVALFCFGLLITTDNPCPRTNLLRGIQATRCNRAVTGVALCDPHGCWIHPSRMKALFAFALQADTFAPLPFILEHNARPEPRQGMTYCLWRPRSSQTSGSIGISRRRVRRMLQRLPPPAVVPLMSRHPLTGNLITSRLVLSANVL